MNLVCRCPIQQSLGEEVAVTHYQEVCCQEEHPRQQLLEADLYIMCYDTMHMYVVIVTVLCACNGKSDPWKRMSKEFCGSIYRST